MRFDTAQTLETLGVKALNPGAYCSAAGWAATAGRSSFAATDPCTGETTARVAGATVEDYNLIIDAAAAAQKTWRMTPAPQRGKLVARIGRLMAENLDALGAIVSIDTGKSLVEGKAEINESIDMATLAAGQSRMLYGFSQQSQRERHRMYDQWLPLGVAGVISAYNFPAAVWAQNGFLSAICGNTVIWKPSPKVPLTAIAIQRLVNQAMEETGHEGVFSLFIPEDNETANHIVVDKRVALVSFTGSSAVGRHVASVIADAPGRRCLLECSGNNGCVIDETADLKLAARSVTFGAVGTTGQRCTSTRRCMVQSQVADEFIDYLRQSFAQVKLGDPREDDTLVGPLIDPRAVDYFEETVGAALQAGGRIAYGGKETRSSGLFCRTDDHRRLRPGLGLCSERDFCSCRFCHELRNTG